jgi:hypothetical protein
VLHPVGELPAAVYWRRRLMVLTLLLAVLAGAGWLGFFLVTQQDSDAAAAAATSSARSPARTPALERVVPSVASVSAPTPPEVLAAEALPSAAPPPAPAAGDPCTDDMISLEVRTPPTVAPGSKPTFELLVANVSAVPCVRTLDKGLQELQLFDSAGTRVWGSNDCFPEFTTDSRGGRHVPGALGRPDQRADLHRRPFDARRGRLRAPRPPRHEGLAGRPDHDRLSSAAIGPRCSGCG